VGTLCGGVLLRGVPAAQCCAALIARASRSLADICSSAFPIRLHSTIAIRGQRAVDRPIKQGSCSTCLKTLVSWRTILNGPISSSPLAGSYEAGSRDWPTESTTFALLFRDYMRTHPEEAAAYAELKYRLAEQHRTDREAYMNAKGPFIWAVMRRATDWSQVTAWQPGLPDA
jgi:hypothetical protein